MYLINNTYKEYDNNRNIIDNVIIPIGSIEAHGKHLPLGTDIFIPSLLCQMLENSRLGGRIYIAPEINYGQSDTFMMYPGTVSIPSDVLANYVYYVCRSFASHGMKKAIFLNGHVGNNTALSLASEKLINDGVDIIRINWWSDLKKEISCITEGIGHAGADETSIMLSYNDNLVKMSLAEKNNNNRLIEVEFKDKGRSIYSNAVSGDPTIATKDKGQKILDLIIEWSINIIERFLNNEY